MTFCDCVIVWTSTFSVCNFFFFFGFIYKEIKWDQDIRKWVLNCDSKFVRVVLGPELSLFYHLWVLLIVKTSLWKMISHKWLFLRPIDQVFGSIVLVLCMVWLILVIYIYIYIYKLVNFVFVILCDGANISNIYLYIYIKKHLFYI